MNGVVDFSVGDDSADAVRIVEINPRLCTSYVGYRALAVDNLAAWILQQQGNTDPLEAGRCGVFCCRRMSLSILCPGSSTVASPSHKTSAIGSYGLSGKRKDKFMELNDHPNEHCI